MGIYKRHNALCDYCEKSTELVRIAVESAEADLLAIGHAPEGEDRTKAMASLREFIARGNELLAAAPANWQLR